MLLILRSIWLVLIAAAMPVSIWFSNQYFGPERPLGQTGFMLLMMLAGTVFQTFFVLQTQVMFPESRRAATFAVLLLIANGVTGITTAEFSVGYGFYTIALTQLSAFCLYLLWYLAQYARTKSRNKLYFVLSERGTFILFAAILAGCLTIIYALAGPMLAEWRDDSPVYAKMLALGAFSADLAGNTYRQIDHNIMHKRHEKSKQAQVSARFAWPITLALIMSMLACIVLAGIAA